MVIISKGGISTMPIYEYECTKCGNHIEVWQKFSDSPVTQCDCCHGKVRKVISQSAFHLKGTGWYVTDYSSKSGNRSGETKKTETKAETKTEAATTPAKDSGASKES
jgi:putative FmdB family regulatory protein